MKFALLTDGTSDKVLLPILSWSLARAGVHDLDGQLVDRGRLPRVTSLSERLPQVVDLYPSDVVFVHRDAENQPPALRRNEIKDAVRVAGSAAHVPVVPVRMTEAWLLGNEGAIRTAAGNPNGRMDLNLPRSSQFESLPDPKRLLHAALRTASGLGPRRLEGFDATRRVHRVVELTEDFSHLDSLPAFSALQSDIREFIGA